MKGFGLACAGVCVQVYVRVCAGVWMKESADGVVGGVWWGRRG